MKLKINKTIIQSFIKLIAVFSLLVGICFVMTYAVHRIPFSLIKDNVESSLATISEEKYYSILDRIFNLPVASHFGGYILDGYSDAVILMEACNIGQDNCLEESLLNKYLLDEKGQPFGVIPNYTSKTSDDKIVYGRYWHGYLITLVPSLICMDLSMIRVFNTFCFLVLVLIICYLTYKKIDLSTALIFIITILVSIFFPVVPYSLQYSSVFYVSLISTVVLLLYEQYWVKNRHYLYFFMVIGSLTSFVDLLTAPIVTLGLPLLFYILLKECKVSISEIILICIVWGMGYGLLWLSKWIIAYFITGYNMVADATAQVSLRLDDKNDYGYIQVFKSVIFGAPTLYRYLMLITLGYFLCEIRSKNIKQNLPLLIVACIPIIWLCLLKNHTMIHYWFTWRNLIVSIFAILLFVYRAKQSRYVSENDCV